MVRYTRGGRVNWEALWGGLPDAPEDVAELIRDDDCLAGKRKQDLCRFFWKLSVGFYPVANRLEIWKSTSAKAQKNLDPFTTFKAFLPVAQVGKH